ncbi:MAG: S8 family peptidase [Candidatus Hydrothermales bacterium]
MIFLLISFLNSEIEGIIREKGYLNLWLKSNNITRISNILENQGARVRAISEWENFMSCYFPSFLLRFKELKKLISEYHVVNRGKKFYKQFKPSSFSPSDYGSSYEVIKFLKIDEVHKRGFIGQNVKISIFDTGFDLNHPALVHIREGKRVKFTYDFNSGDSMFLNANNLKYGIPKVRAIGYIGKTSLTGNKDTLFIFYNFLNERDNSKNLWRIYGNIFLNNNFSYRDRLTPLSPDTISLLPSAVYYKGKVYLAYKMILFPGSEAIAVSFLNKDLHKDSFKILTHAPFIFDLEIFIFNDKINIVYSDTLSIKIIDLNRNVLFSRNVKAFSLKVNEKNNLIFVLYEMGILRPISGLMILDTLYRVIKDTILSPGQPHFIRFKEDTTQVLLVSGSKRDTLYELKFDSYFNLYTKKIIDAGFFIKSPVYFQNKIYYTKNGFIYHYYRGTIDSILEYFVDDLNCFNNFTVFRRRGDKKVNLDPLTDFTDPLSGAYHGTRMLGLIGGYTPGELIGTAPGAEFLLFKTERTKTVEGYNFENIVEEDFWVEALELSHRLGANIVSSSLGYSDWYEKKDMNGKTAISSRAASKALSKGILVFTAAGNVSHKDTTKADTTIVAPGDADSVITVGGVKLDGKIWNGSAFGPTSDGRIKPDVVAPYTSVTLYKEITQTGDSIYSYSQAQGTSVSTALMAGFAASILSAHPSWDARKLYLSIIMSSSKYLSPDNIYGYGIPDALKALNFEETELPQREGEKSRIISVYPNPTKGDILNIDYIINESLTPVSIKIFTPSGKKVYEKSTFLPLGRYKEVINLKLDVKEKIFPGFYIITFETSESKDYIKLIVER